MIELNIYPLVNRLEAKLGRRVTDNEIATVANVHRHTVATARKGKEEPVITKLVQYFRSQGFDIQAGDLFTETKPVTDTSEQR